MKHEVKSGYFTIYQSKEYPIVNNEELGIILFSEDKIDQKNGFKLYERKKEIIKDGKTYVIEYPDNMPTLYYKRVTKSQLGEIYRVWTSATYMGYTGIPIESETEDSVLLVTDDESFIDKCDFEWTDRRFYTKEVKKDEVELVQDRELVPDYFERFGDGLLGKIKRLFR